MGSSSRNMSAPKTDTEQHTCDRDRMLNEYGYGFRSQRPGDRRYELVGACINMGCYSIASSKPSAGFGHKAIWDPNRENWREIRAIVRCGMDVDNATGLLKCANDEARQSKELLQETSNSVVAMADIIEPKLMALVKRTREARMGVVSELSQSLSVMRDVRKFFLEENYAEEVARLERFVSVCKELRDLRADGTLDAVADIAIRLAVKETR